MFELADATNSFSSAPKIIEHCLAKIKSPSFEWRRIYKSLCAIEFLIKNGNPNVIGKLQMQGQGVISSLQSFDYQEDSIDRGK
jgi:hypothetical protein